MNTKFKLYNLIKLKCPKCHKGNLFTKGGLFVVNKIYEMHKKCLHCNQDFKIESNYYSVVSWINYPIIAVVFIHLIVSMIALHEMYELPLKILIPIFMIIGITILIPIIRISRAVLIYLTVNFIQGNQKK
jgi:uncharacterized protein (DUF983 family)